MVAIASLSQGRESATSGEAARPQAAVAKVVQVRRFSPSSIAAVAVSFLVFVGLTAGAAVVLGTVVTKVAGSLAGL